MKNINTAMLSKLQESWYSFEEIQRINESIESLNQGKWIPFYEAMSSFYSNKEKKVCIK